MKRLVVVRADDDIKEMTDMTFPIIKKFCKEWDAEFMVLDHKPPVMSDDRRPHFRITKIADLLSDYDRVLNLDCDLLINKTCPNIFDVVPEDCIGTIYEDVGSRMWNRRARIDSAQEMFGNIGWEKGYINTGVFLVSKMHSRVFERVNGRYYTQDGSDDVHIGYNIVRLGFKVHELPYTFNHMTMFSESGTNRFDSYIIHYAGHGVFDYGRTRNEQIKKDLEKVT